MTLQVDRQRLADAYQTVRAQLLSERTHAGHWVGELSSSPLSTATAISALVLAEQERPSSGLPAFTPGEEPSHIDEIYRNDLSELIIQSIQWLARQQNDDGGWGDTDRSQSNIATTMLVQAAFHLTGVPAKYRDLLERAEAYVESQGGIAGLKRRYEGDKTFAVPILANCALADMVPWRKVAALPFEMACLPQRWYNRLNLPVVSYAIPALVAIGQAKFHHCPPRNPLLRWIRRATEARSLALLAEKQPQSGGFLEATPLTSFVVMSLASIGKTEHPIVRRGVEFLLASVRSDGSWPIDTNLSTWNSSQALLALDWQCSAEPEETETSTSPSVALAEPFSTSPSDDAHRALDWLLRCQHCEKHVYTGAAPGGWAWTDLTGGVPDADDTSAALLALAAWRKRWPEERASQIKAAARAGIHWLLKLQNNNGGWPTFCRGWGKFPFDRSATDITAHAIRALHAWSDCLHLPTSQADLSRRIGTATQLGLKFLESQQEPDGCWIPLWFGNEQNRREANPVYGTAKVLMMYQELKLGHTDIALRGVHWLTKVQHATGGWGVVCDSAQQNSASEKVPEAKTATGKLMPENELSAKNASSTTPPLCSTEETALAISALLPYYELQNNQTYGLQENRLNGLPKNRTDGPHGGQSQALPGGRPSRYSSSIWAVSNRSPDGAAGGNQPSSGVSRQLKSSVELGYSWLIDAIEQGHYLEPAPIGFYFAKLWYYERLYPQIFTAQALSSACQKIPVTSVPVGAGY